MIFCHQHPSHHPTRQYSFEQLNPQNNKQTPCLTTTAENQLKQQITQTNTAIEAPIHLRNFSLPHKIPLTKTERYGTYRQYLMIGGLSGSLRDPNAFNHILHILRRRWRQHTDKISDHKVNQHPNKAYSFG